MLTNELLNELEQLDQVATPAGWGVWIEPTPTLEDVARELRTLAEGSEFSGKVVMINGPAGLAPAVTGCGPRSEANAHLICAMRNNLHELLRLARIGQNVVNMLDGEDEILDAFDKLREEMTGAGVKIRASDWLKELEDSSGKAK